MTLDPYLSLVLSFGMAAASAAATTSPTTTTTITGPDHDAHMHLADTRLNPSLVLHRGYLSLTPSSPPFYCILTSTFFIALHHPIDASIHLYERLDPAWLQVEVDDGDDGAVTVRAASHRKPLVLRASGGGGDLRAWAGALLAIVPDPHDRLDLESPPPSSSSSPSRLAPSNSLSSSGASGGSSSSSLKGFRPRARIFVTSWNMGAQNPDLTGDLELSPDYHIYAFGVQECPNGALFRHIDRQMARMGCCRLPVHDKHERIYGRGDGAILQPKFTGLVVYVRRAELAHVQVLRAAVCATGKGSKGAVAVVLDAFGVSVGLFCAHLSSESVAKRRADLAQIFQSLGTGLALGDGRHFDVADQFDHCIFFGDLNFRVSGVSVAEAVLALQTDAMSVLYDADELRGELREDRSLFGFVEPRLRFLPTYKLNRDRPRCPDRTRADWPQRRYTLHFKGYWYKSPRQDPVRIPSWCDRILFSNGNCCRSILIPKVDDGADCYDVFADGVLTGSDHAPVYAAFDLLLMRSRRDVLSFTPIYMFQVTIYDLTICSPGSGTPIAIGECLAMLRRSSLLPAASERFAYAARPFQLFCAAQSVADAVQLLLQVTLADGSAGSCRLLLRDAEMDADEMRVIGPLPLSSSGSALRSHQTDAVLSLKALLSVTCRSIR